MIRAVREQPCSSSIGPHPHPALQRFPQLLVSPIMQGLLWQGMFKDKAPLDVKELYIAYLDIILPEK